MDAEYRAQLEEQLKIQRRLLHAQQMKLARAGFSADPSLEIMAEDLQAEVDDLEAQLGIERYTPPPRRPATRYEPRPMPEPEFRARVVGQQTHARQADIDHHFTLLKTYRGNLAHYRTQAKAFGGIELAPPITRHGMNEGRAGIAQAKAALRQLGVEPDDLPGDE